MTALPATLPEPFDLVKTCPAHKDGTVNFESRTYAVPFQYLNKSVEVHGCAGFVQMLDRKDGQVLVTDPRGTAQMLLVDPRCYEGPAPTGWRRPSRWGA